MSRFIFGQIRFFLRNHLEPSPTACSRVCEILRRSSRHALPKTRSGKIMRRLLREIVTSNSVTGDVTTLEDLSVVTRLAAQQEEE